MVSEQFVIDIMLPCLFIVALCPYLSHLEHLISCFHRRWSPCLLEAVVGDIEKFYVAAYEMCKSVHYEDSACSACQQRYAYQAHQ